MHKQVGMGIGDIRTLGKPMWCNGGVLTQNARDVGSIPALDTIFPISITPTTLVAVTMVLYKLCTVWLLNLSCVCLCKAIARVYIIVSIKRLTIPSVVVWTDLRQRAA